MNIKTIDVFRLLVKRTLHKYSSYKLQNWTFLLSFHPASSPPLPLALSLILILPLLLLILMYLYDPYIFELIYLLLFRQFNFN